MSVQHLTDLHHGVRSRHRLAQVQRSLEDLNSSVKGMEDYLHGLQGVCAHKSSQWASRSQSRADILEGLQRSRLTCSPVGRVF